MIEISKCRICGNENLVTVLNLGKQYLTSIFPSLCDKKSLELYPLELVKCHGSGNACNLVQLKHSVKKDLMYSQNYGYRSGLNSSMVKHLKNKVRDIETIVDFVKGDIVLDIGSNDGTTLSFYSQKLERIGIDPTAKKFKKYYKSDINIIEDYFSSDLVQQIIGNKKIKVITSLSMFYDLDNPLSFSKEISQILDPNSGIWVLEQSYLPTMLKKLSFDTICHEHLEYYSLSQIHWIAKNSGMKIVNVDFNEVNGGSFAVTICNEKSRKYNTSDMVHQILKREEQIGLKELAIFHKFSQQVEIFKNEFNKFLSNIIKSDKKILGIGASTKGNVLLQYCGINSNIIPAIGEVNPEKFGKYTPGSWIKIINEKKIFEQNPDYLLILPWHFKNFFKNERKYRKFDLIFPIPNIHVIKKK